MKSADAKTAILHCLMIDGTLLATVAAVVREGSFERAARALGVHTVILGGGVAANKRLRSRLTATLKQNKLGISLFLPRVSLTTDNAAMIASSAYFHALRRDFVNWKKLRAHATLGL